MCKPLVYLAGGITGLLYGEAVDWREYARDYLSNWGIRTASPMRFKNYLSSEKRIADVYEEHPLSSLIGINLRDHNDVRRCDGVLVNFIGAKAVSIETCIEIGAAMALNKPIVVAMEPPREVVDQWGDDSLVETFEKRTVQNPHWHAMVRASNLVVPTLEEALECLASVLSTDDDFKKPRFTIHYPEPPSAGLSPLLSEAGME